MKRKIEIFCCLLTLLLLLTACFDYPAIVPTTEFTLTPGESTTMPEDSFFQVHYLDVGQADSALVVCDGKMMLIDGGNTADSSMVYSYLKRLGVEYLDYIVCTHGHEDHVGGLPAALSLVSAGRVYCSVTEYDSSAFRAFVTHVERQDLAIQIPEPGTQFQLGNATCTVLGPTRESDEPNNMSIVLKIQYGNTSFVFTGDAEQEEETDILDAGYDVSCDVLKVAHHGSDTSTSYRFLREAMPQYAVISVGADNDYGHPTENTLSKLRDAEVIVYRTDMQGTVICTSNGETVSFTVERNATADTLGGAGEGGNHSGDTDKNGTEGTQSPDNESQTYIANTRSLKFHLEECESAKNMSEKNKETITATREEMLDMGYEPCGLCNP